MRLQKQIEMYKPLAVNLEPPCTSFGQWAHLSKAMHPETWSRSREAGECLGQFAANLCKLQMSGHMHFILQNLVGPGVFSLVCSRQLWDSRKVVSINAPQCALVVKVSGEHVYKNAFV